MVSTAGVARKIVRNTLFNIVGRFWAIGVGFALTPYIVAHLGPDRFGIWAFVLTALASAGMLDLGIGAALVPHIAAATARHEGAAVGRYIGTALGGSLGVTLLLAALLLLASDWLIAQLTIPPALLPEARQAFRLAALLFVAANLNALAQAILLGLQRLGRANGILWATSVVQVCATIVVLSQGLGVVALTWVNIATNTLTLCGLALIIYPCLPQDGHLSWHRPTLKRLLAYGLRAQFTTLTALVTHQAGKFLLGTIGVNAISAVGAYELGYRVAFTLVSFPLMLLSALTPAVAELGEGADLVAVQRLYARASRYLALVAIPLGILSIWAAPWLIAIWVGPEATPILAWVVLAGRWLLFGLFINLITGVGTTVVRGLNRPGDESRYAALMLCGTLGLGVWWSRHGFWGPLAAFGVASLVSSALFLWLFHRRLALPLAPFLVAVYARPVAAALVGVMVLGLLFPAPTPQTLALPRLELVLLFTPRALLFALLYGGIAAACKALTRADLDYFRHLLGRRRP